MTSIQAIGFIGAAAMGAAIAQTCVVVRFLAVMIDIEEAWPSGSCPKEVCHEVD